MKKEHQRYQTDIGEDKAFPNNTDLEITIQNLKEIKEKETFLNIGFNSIECEETNLNTCEDNYWVYDYASLPILSIDESNSKTSSISVIQNAVATFKWNNFTSKLEKIRYQDDITLYFKNEIEKNEDVIEFYIHNSDKGLSRLELEQITDEKWLKSSYFTINDEGFHIVYARTLIDDEYYYVNSDILVLDRSIPQANIGVLEKNYNTLGETPNTYFINQSTYYTIDATDELSGIKSIEYFITDKIVEDLSNIKWLAYEKPILINQTGTSILYAKVTDLRNLFNQFLIFA